MSLPANTSQPERQRVANILWQLQVVLHEVNPYVVDCVTAMEWFGQHGGDEYEIIIGRDGIPTGAHAGAFDPATDQAEEHFRRACFREVTVLQEEGRPGDHHGAVLIRERGGGTHVVHITNRAHDPLHFVLLLPYGEDGWHPNIRRLDREVEVFRPPDACEGGVCGMPPDCAYCDVCWAAWNGRRRRRENLSMRQFYAYRLMVRGLLHPSQRFGGSAYMPEVERCSEHAPPRLYVTDSDGAVVQDDVLSRWGRLFQELCC